MVSEIYESTRFDILMKKGKDEDVSILDDEEDTDDLEDDDDDIDFGDDEEEEQF